MEFILHFMYVVAIKDTKAWMGDTPAQISMIGFWNLMIVWLKVTIKLISAGVVKSQDIFAFCSF